MPMNNMAPLRPSSGGGGGGGYADFEAGFLSQPFRPSGNAGAPYDPMGIGSEAMAGFMRQPFRPSSERFGSFTPKIPHSGSKLDRFRGPFGSKRMEDMLGKGLTNFLADFADWWYTRAPWAEGVPGKSILPAGWQVHCPGWLPYERFWGTQNTCGTGPTSGSITLPANLEGLVVFSNGFVWSYATEGKHTILGPTFFRRNAQLKRPWPSAPPFPSAADRPAWYRPTDANDHSWPESWPDEAPASEGQPSGETFSWPGYRSPATEVHITPDGVHRGPDTTHREVPSGEAKVKWLRWASGIFGTMTEVGDFFEALADALPDDRCKRKGIYDTAVCVLENWDEIDPVDAGKNLIANQIEDAIIGKTLGALQNAGRNLGAGGLTGFELWHFLDTAIGASFDSGAAQPSRRPRLPFRKMNDV